MRLQLIHENACFEEFIQELNQLRHEFKKVHDKLKAIRSVVHNHGMPYPFTEEEKLSDKLVAEKCSKLQGVFENMDGELRKLRTEIVETESRILLPIVQSERFEEEVVDDVETCQRKAKVEKTKEIAVISLTGESGEEGEQGEKIQADPLMMKVVSPRQSLERVDIEKKWQSERMERECGKRIKSAFDHAKTYIHVFKETLDKEINIRQKLERQLQARENAAMEKRIGAVGEALITPNTPGCPNDQLSMGYKTEETAAEKQVNTGLTDWPRDPSDFLEHSRNFLYSPMRKQKNGLIGEGLMMLNGAGRTMQTSASMPILRLPGYM